uniref:DUF72 domain-containing protein n=1 Tax=Stutzerimonas nitrititolerans TaxID=2482751 RepID=UPI0035E3FB88
MFPFRTRIATKREQTLEQARIARVAPDPAPFAEAARPGGWTGFRYYRLHGSPRIYYSAYGGDRLASLTERLVEAPKGVDTWCIFDNTASGGRLPMRCTCSVCSARISRPLKNYLRCHCCVKNRLKMLI